MKAIVVVIITSAISVSGLCQSAPPAYPKYRRSELKQMIRPAHTSEEFENLSTYLEVKRTGVLRRLPGLIHYRFLSHSQIPQSLFLYAVTNCRGMSTYAPKSFTALQVVGFSVSGRAAEVTRRFPCDPSSPEDAG